MTRLWHLSSCASISLLTTSCFLLCAVERVENQTVSRSNNANAPGNKTSEQRLLPPKVFCLLDCSGHGPRCYHLRLLNDSNVSKGFKITVWTFYALLLAMILVTDPGFAVEKQTVDDTGTCIGGYEAGGKAVLGDSARSHRC